MRNYQPASFGDFRCAHCHIIVSCMHMLSGVNNRNHCPYCLWSCHLDLYAAGDRLSACKAPMKPIGLTLKRSRNKYQLSARGELMLIHECSECKSISINRIAADDDSEAVLTVFRSSLMASHSILYEHNGIISLKDVDINLIHTQLYGRHAVTA